MKNSDNQQNDMNNLKIMEVDDDYFNQQTQSSKTEVDPYKSANKREQSIKQSFREESSVDILSYLDKQELKVGKAKESEERLKKALESEFKPSDE